MHLPATQLQVFERKEFNKDIVNTFWAKDELLKKCGN